MDAKPVVGFIGVGLMGWGMAKNAVEKGFPLRVIAHRKREAVEDLVRRGAQELGSAEELAEACDIVVLCVTGSPQVEDNVRRMMARAKPGFIVIDTSTAEPSSTVRLAEEMSAKQMQLIDAPLSRTPSHAWDGELTTYVGGPAAVVEQLRPLFETWASVVIPTEGAVGSAHTIKLANNLISIGYAAIWSEAYGMVERAGLKASVFHEVVTNSGMNCGNFQNYSKYVLENDNSAHKFALSNCYKDITYYTRLAAAHDGPTTVSSGVLETLRLGVNLGHGDRYLPEMIEIYRDIGGSKQKRPPR
ncbi:MAG: NAD(P)-dependent oxidoreductase [Neomegalonema sp.]|nr:NAD(P)-dependent oxidoreductase [Neomegalonema sp.]